MLKDNLRMYRERLGMSAKVLAERVGIPGNTYRNYENSDRQPDYRILKKIARELQVSVDQLLAEPEEEVEFLYDPDTFRKHNKLERAFDSFGKALSLETEEFLLLMQYQLAPKHVQQEVWKKLEYYHPQNAVRIFQNACVNMQKLVENGKITEEEYGAWEQEAEEQKKVALKGKLKIVEFDAWLLQKEKELLHRDDNFHDDSRDIDEEKA